MSTRADPVQLATLALIALGGYVAWRAYRAVSGGISSAVGTVTQYVDQGLATARSSIMNAISLPPAPGEKAFLYSDESYTGLDANGQPLMDGARANEDFRRMEYAEKDAGTLPAASNAEGTAFGAYRIPKRYGAGAKQ